VSLPPPPAATTSSFDTATVPADRLGPLAGFLDLLIRECLVEGRAGLGAALTDCRARREAGGEVVVELPLTTRELDHHQAFLRRRLARDLGEEAVIHLRATSEDLDERRQRRERYRVAEDHELVRFLRETFKAEIVAREQIDHQRWREHLRGDDRHDHS